jgi:hypothetical protein
VLALQLSSGVHSRLWPSRVTEPVRRFLTSGSAKQARRRSSPRFVLPRQRSRMDPLQDSPIAKPCCTTSAGVRLGELADLRNRSGGGRFLPTFGSRAQLVNEDLFAWVDAGPPQANRRELGGLELFEDALSSGFRVTYFVNESEPYVAVLRVRRLN